MTSTHELLCLTVTTMADEDAWLSVQESVKSMSADEARASLEELLVISAGSFVTAAGAFEVDVMGLIDDNYDLLYSQVNELIDPVEGQ